MNTTPRMELIRATTDYIAPTVHYNRRKFDKKYEIVGRLPDRALDGLELNIGGEVVLDVQENRQAALASVRFFRRQEG